MIRIDTSRREVFKDKKRVNLARKEYDLLATMFQSPRAWTRDELASVIWNADGGTKFDTRAIDQHIARMRRKLGKVVETSFGYGYRISMDVKAA